MGTRILGAPRQSPKGYIYGFVVAYSSASVMTCGAGYCRDADDTYDINASSMPNFDFTLTGAGGRRSGLVEAANTWYHAFVIADSRGINAPSSFIDSTLVPTLPAGYDKYRRVHTFRNDGSSNIRSFNLVKRGGETREIHWRVSEATAQVVASGTASSFTSVSLSTLIPPNATVGYFKVNIHAPGDADFVRFRSSVDSTITDPPTRIFGGDIATGNSVATDTFYMISADQTIQYQVVPAGAWVTYTNIWVLGYIDHL